MSERPRTSQHGGYRPGSGRKSTLGKAHSTTPPASGVGAYLQQKALERFNEIWEAQVALALGAYVAVYGLKEIKPKSKNPGTEVSGGVTMPLGHSCPNCGTAIGDGKPLYVFQRPPHPPALEWVLEQVVGKATTKSAAETDNVYVINHSIPRPDYGDWRTGATPPSADAELSISEAPEEWLESIEATEDLTETDDAAPLSKDQLLHKAIQDTLMARMLGQANEPDPEALLRERLTRRKTETGPVTNLTATALPQKSVPDFIPDPDAPPSQPVVETPSHAPLKKFFELPL